MQAYEKVAAEYEWANGGVARRRYQEAKEILKGQLVITTDAKLARLVCKK
jgi:hypothetical protein